MTAATASPPTRDPLAWAMLFLCGFCWGSTGPLSKLAVSTGHHPVGITFWNTVISAIFFTGLIVAKGSRPPLDRRHVVFFLICGFLGTALPNSLSYEAYRHLPVGVNVMILSLVPMATLLIALPLGVERLDVRRALGLVLGVAAVALISLPSASLPSPDQAVWIILPVIVATAYAAENVFIAATRPPATGPMTVMWGLSVGAFLLITPVAVAMGAVFDVSPLGPPEQAVIGAAVLHICAYFGYVWLIGRAGPVFASQVGYVVTATGVMLGMAIYGERHSVWVWSALVVMMAGLALVRPKGAEG